MKTNFSPEARRTVGEYTYMADRLFSVAVNKPIAEHIISTIMGKKLTIIEMYDQKESDNLYSKACRFDVLAKDDCGKYYNIEVQNANEGAVPLRARYNAECLDWLLIKKGVKYEEYPETYVIFITEQDVLKKSLPIYHIERYIEETHEKFEDRQHIIYVNGENTDLSTPLGQLMADMQQADPDKINNKVMADRMAAVKNPLGKEYHAMCKEIEAMEARVSARVSEKTRIETREDDAVNAAKMSFDLGIDKIATINGLIKRFGLTRDTAEKCVNKALLES